MALRNSHRSPTFGDSGVDKKPILQQHKDIIYIQTYVSFIRHARTSNHEFYSILGLSRLI
jgi:hypothetical protein